MRKAIVGLVFLLLALAGPAAAQDDGSQGARAELLRQQIEDRFAARVQEELGLDAAQAARLRETTSSFAAKRRDLAQRERLLRRALAAQLRPGVAADQDSVGTLTDHLMDVKLGIVQNYRDEMRELGKVLSPVQRAQFYMMRERLLQRVQDLREQRAGPAGAGPRGRLRP